MTLETTPILNPYVGPRTFQAEESDRFFGREREARDLLSLVIAERVTLFYAQSGAGKSSLVNTRLIPGLREAGFLVLPVTRVSGDPPPAVYGVAFSPDGKLLASASGDKTIRLWQTNPILLACTIAGRNLMRDEWLLYFSGEPPRLTCPQFLLQPSFLQPAVDLAQSGEITAAVAAYQDVLKLDPRLNINPRQEANREFAKTVVISATNLAQSGDITASLAAINKTQQLDPQVEIPANTWNAICWFGSLNHLAARVLDACDKAVTAAPENGNIRDSRGLARALTDDRKGAIDDFEAYVAQLKQNGGSEEEIKQRQAWIDTLKAGKNPFDTATLAKLRGQ